MAPKQPRKWRCQKCGEHVRVDGVRLVKHVAKTDHPHWMIQRRIPGKSCENTGLDVSAQILASLEERLANLEESTRKAVTAENEARRQRDEWVATMQKNGVAITTDNEKTDEGKDGQGT